MTTRDRQNTRYWPTDKAIAVLDGTPSPPPIWTLGDVIAVGEHTMLRSFEIWKCTCGNVHTDRHVNIDYAAGDVTHLVREQKPVQP